MRSPVLHALGFLSCVCLSASASGEEPKPLTPAEKYKALVKAHRTAQKEYQEAYQAAKTDEERNRVYKELGVKADEMTHLKTVLSFIREHPKDPVVLDAYYSMAVCPYREDPICDEAAKIVAEHWAGDERMVKLSQDLIYSCSESSDRLLRATIEKNPRREAQGYARHSLAMSLIERADTLQKQSVETRAPYEREAEKLLQETAEKYADLKYLRTTLGKSAEAELNVIRNVTVGKKLQEVEGEDIDGKKMKLSDYRGKILLIDCWDSTCRFCLLEAPEKKAMLKRYEGKPFAVIGVNTDEDRAAAKKANTDHALPWPSFWSDATVGGPLAQRWNIRAWPTLYVVDTEGVIRYKGDILRSVCSRKKADGEWESYHFYEDVVDTLLKELEAKKK